MKVTACRICENRALTLILKLGRIPVVNYFPSYDELGDDPRTYPLNLALCARCGLVMLDEIVPRTKLFRDYHYLTSASPPLVEHFSGLAAECRDRGWLHEGTKVLDIGANDGTLLSEFKKAGARTLGIDPAANAVVAARKAGIEVLPAFFDEAAAKRIGRAIGKFDIVTATNVLAHVDSITTTVAGIKRVLAPGGIVIVEVAHLLEMILRTQFDAVYHEHASFLSMRPLLRVFGDAGLQIFDVQKVSTQGGSIRIHARAATEDDVPPSPRIAALCKEEAEHRIHDIATLRRFARGVRGFRRDLRALISEIRSRKQRIVGLGAPAKGVMLLNYCGIGPRDLAYVVDSTDLKHGRFIPGTRIPVYSERALETESRACDYFFLLSWNFEAAMLEKIERFRAAGAKVIIPFPKLRVV